MARTGIGRIDDLLDGRATDPIGAGSDAETIGFVQDLLIGHDFKSLPGVLGASRGTFGPHTAEAVRQFQQAHTVPATGTIDRATLNALATTPWARPFACCGYLTLVLDVAFTGVARLVSLTSQFEGAGRFTAMNRNTDGAGLSFGLIQWAQKPGRLNELLRAFEAQQPARFVEVFGAGDPALARGLIEHTAKPRGGTDDTGHATDARFDLIAAPWDARFVDAGTDVSLQRVQIGVATAAFEQSIAHLRAFAPEIRSERGLAFMLDLANQHGDGGAEKIFNRVRTPGVTEPELLAAIAEESVARVQAQFPNRPEIIDATRARRTAFRTTALLSDASLGTA
jgi:peptidoglycan hydrolase-like protein with peptidoglycan-binding domain